MSWALVLALIFVQCCALMVACKKPLEMGSGHELVLGTCPNTILRRTK